jgi:DNA invertase Pin-like site-specific DNA recombinase
LETQIDALSKAGCDRIYRETAGGKKAGRPELGNCLKALRPGDCLVVWKLDRLGRSLPDLIQTVNDLAVKGVTFESLTERIETESVAGKLVFHVFAALADFERDLIRERTLAGLEVARKKGKVGGRPRKMTSRDVANAKKAINGGMSLKEVAKLYGVGKTTLFDRLKEVRDYDA